MSDLHIVFAVLAPNNHKVRVSMPTDWDTAQQKFDRLNTARLDGKKPSVLGREVKFFAVRSADDPDWPTEAPLLRVRVPKSAIPSTVLIMYNGESVPKEHRYVCRLTTSKGSVMAGDSNPIYAQAHAYFQARRENII